MQDCLTTTVRDVQNWKPKTVKKEMIGKEVSIDVVLKNSQLSSRGDVRRQTVPEVASNHQTCTSPALDSTRMSGGGIEADPSTSQSAHK